MITGAGKRDGKHRQESFSKMLIIAMPFAIVGTKFSEASDWPTVACSQLAQLAARSQTYQAVGDSAALSRLQCCKCCALKLGAELYSEEEGLA